MEMRRQITVSWDSGGSDEAPPKVRPSDCFTDSLLSVFGMADELKQTVIFLSVAQQTRLPESSLQ